MVDGISLPSGRNFTLEHVLAGARILLKIAFQVIALYLTPRWIPHQTFVCERFIQGDFFTGTPP